MTTTTKSAAVADQTTRLDLEDHGQDFLWFEVKGDTIVGCGPFQQWLWVGKKIIPPSRWRKGARVTFEDLQTLNYPVLSVSLAAAGAL